MIADHLKQAERHVADGARHVERQREIVAELEADGHGAAARQAAALLVQFEEVQALLVADRDRLIKELAEKSKLSRIL